MCRFIIRRIRLGMLPGIAPGILPGISLGILPGSKPSLRIRTRVFVSLLSLNWEMLDDSSGRSYEDGAVPKRVTASPDRS